ncbi:GtrA family protein [Nonomuraea sediminis]|uniref:GtrA family protein n=1 Tax=Nonomuraea sediminis TaxID=2835864 RepID=UPI001BDD39D5|nr:GtrA family protein [Nonomuraea sediminis]
MDLIRRLYQRFAALVHELAKFGVIGAIAFVLSYGIRNLLWVLWGSEGTITATVIATVIATTFAYVGNRYWTYRHRDQNGLGREYLLFFMLNGIGLLIEVLCVGFSKYTLGFQSLLANNIASLIGTGLGTLFRFWSYRRWVFLEATEPIPAELPEVKQGR